MPLTQNSLNNHARWSVMWFSKGKWKRRRFGEEFTGAMKFLLDHTDLKGIHLHSDNISFPPPKSVTEHEETRFKVVTLRGKKYKKRVTTIVNRMGDLNRKGVWWCPYCIKFRHFKQIETAERGTEMCCPACWVSSYEPATAKYNPLHMKIEYGQQYRRTTNGKRGRRARAR